MLVQICEYLMHFREKRENKDFFEIRGNLSVLAFQLKKERQKDIQSQYICTDKSFQREQGFISEPPQGSHYCPSLSYVCHQNQRQALL